MRIYLAQHGEATSSEENRQRPLSDKGVADVRKIGDFLYAEAKLCVPEVLHSGKLRGEQTAELFARCLNGVYSAAADLNPNDDPALCAAHLATREKDVMLVGHLPHISKLTALLLTGDANQTPVTFQNASVVCLERDAENAWHLQWMLTPDLLEK
ncbi:MAG: phosphohistidine phosphatase SixA [Mariprofundaceae bacterium]|nr:phosphohistidine phosphatase SixA [Mariprofundaceae bacterium]